MMNIWLWLASYVSVFGIGWVIGYVMGYKDEKEK